MNHTGNNISSMPIGAEEQSTSEIVGARNSLVSDHHHHHHHHHNNHRQSSTYGSSMYPSCVEPCVRSQNVEAPLRQCVHVIFLLSFVLFLVVGVALTCLGFLDYGAGGVTSKTFRVLGIVALLLCIGFLIAACVILSECVTSAIKAPIDDEYGYHALYPSYSDSFNSALGDRAAVYANYGHPVIIPTSAYPNPNISDHPSISAQALARHNFQPVSAMLCASCSCQLIGPLMANPNVNPNMNLPASVSCPQSIVHFNKEGRVNVASEKTSDTNSSYLFDIQSEDDDPMHNEEEPREWV